MSRSPSVCVYADIGQTVGVKGGLVSPARLRFKTQVSVTWFESRQPRKEEQTRQGPEAGYLSSRAGAGQPTLAGTCRLRQAHLLDSPILPKQTAASPHQVVFLWSCGGQWPFSPRISNVAQEP